MLRWAYFGMNRRGKALLDLATGEVTPLLEGLQLGAYFPTPISDLNGVAVGPSGAIYVSSDKMDVVYKLTLRRK